MSPAADCLEEQFQACSRLTSEDLSAPRSQPPRLTPWPLHGRLDPVQDLNRGEPSDPRMRPVLVVPGHVATKLPTYLAEPHGTRIRRVPSVFIERMNLSMIAMLPCIPTAPKRWWLPRLRHRRRKERLVNSTPLSVTIALGRDLLPRPALFRKAGTRQLQVPGQITHEVGVFVDRLADPHEAFLALFVEASHPRRDWLPSRGTAALPEPSSILLKARS